MQASRYAQGLDAETQVSVDRPGEETWFGCAEIARRALSVVWDATGTERRSAIAAPLSIHEGKGVGPPWQPHCQHAPSGAWLQPLWTLEMCTSKFWEHASATRVGVHMQRQG